MAYKQYTTCVQPGSHVKMNQYVQIVIQGLLAAGIAALFVAAAGEPWCLLIALEIGAIMSTIGYCHWWLDDRLICLDGDQVAIGMLVSVEPPWKKTGFDAIDTDYSINLLLAPNPSGVKQAAAETSTPYGFLMKENDATKNIGLPFTGTVAKDEDTGKDCAVFHGEFEGAGVADTLLGAQIALALAVTALILCLAGPWGAVAAAVLALLALLAALLGLGVGLGDTGSPTDVNPSLSSLHATDGPEAADLIAMQGRWVYDAGHNNEGKGWNEIHPIKLCTKVGSWEGDWPEDVDGWIKIWERALHDAGAPGTVANQQQPQNHWDVHPLIDGCRPDDEEPPPIH